MKAQHSRIALALAATLICVSPMVGAESGDAPAQDSLRADIAEPAAARPGQSRIEDGSANRNSPHPAVLSFERPVYPIGVPNPPVSLERY